ncbi:MAG: hypothetical protein HQL23_00855 [Candidatus Omnitrophica bacterium]|nr:hypothetical protein [Candidatus Omnitrophota bacterium]
MRKIIFCLCLFGLWVLPTAVNAGILVEQGKVQLKFTPGQNTTGKLMVHNTEGKEIKIRAYWEDFEYQPPYDGAKKFMPPGSIPRSCSAWIKFTPTDFVLPPFAKQEIAYVINPPADSSGGYYGVMFFEPVVDRPQTKMGVKIVSRVGSLFFLESTPSKREAGLKDFAFNDPGMVMKFVNSGDVTLIPVGTFYVMSEQGDAVDRGDMDKIYVPGGATADYKIKFNAAYPAGKYTAVLTVDLGEENVLVKEVDFVKDAAGKITLSAVRD